jgi:hypothetical protein
MATKSDKLSIAAITAKYRIQPNVVEILAQMLGIPITEEPENFPLVIENISGEILLRFNCLIPIIDTKQLIRIIDSKFNFPEGYTHYMLKTIDRTKYPPTGEFITTTGMADVDHETERYEVKYIQPNYIDLRNINVFIIIFTGNIGENFTSITTHNGYVIKEMSTSYRIKCSLEYLKEYNLTIIKILFGDEIYDIVCDVVDNYKLKKKVDSEIQRTLSKLYSVIGKNLDVSINGKSLIRVMNDVRTQIIHKYHLPSNFDSHAELKLHTWSNLRGLFKNSVLVDTELQPVTYLMRSAVFTRSHVPVYQSLFVR